MNILYKYMTDSLICLFTKAALVFPLKQFVILQGNRVCFVALRTSQQLWSWRDGQFTKPHFFLGKLEQAVNQYFVHILSLVTGNNHS